MWERSAIFIDGAYLYQVLAREYQGARINYQTFSLRLAEGTDLLLEADEHYLIDQPLIDSVKL